MNYDKIDEAMLPFNEFAGSLSLFNGRITDDLNMASMHIENIQLSLPIQLDISVDENGDVTLGASPPLYYISTTVLPVFHNIKLTVSKHS